ncbi:hypothetical protein N0V93_009259 [Gnomoniopsis smithogilvyi]|uniref:Uncharacterized protein n=1 Tax=Gnomoniopsis smithogilvyi TaxID=1191159 RepID=A0A9W8YKF0_9PEZI|nr:hypothetical protein N0V93_009259 [Gnomoniopsis smithogilvyi]
MASEVASNSVYDRNTDRPIRPLPKRRLRERLSPEVADSIKYPPAPQSTPALFSYPCNLKGGFEEEASSSGRDFQPEFSSRQSSRRNGGRHDTDLDEVALRRTVVPRAPIESLGRPARLLQKPDTSRQGQSPQPPPSAASSADGYDSFENTNNKKKRKIPTAGEMNGGHGLGDHGLNDAHSLPGGLAVTPDRSGENGNSSAIAYYGSGSFMSTGQNVSGPGRGRFGRARSGRSPLQTLADTSGNWLGRGSKTRSATWSPQPAQSTGIISNAIANAEKLVPSENQENISLLQQQQSVKTTSASTQFTFTCDSQVPGSLAWPGSDPKMTSSASADHDTAVRSYPHSRATQPAASGASPQGGPPSDSSLRGEASHSVSSERKNRRRLAKELQIQARKRREDTQRQNWLHPQKAEDMWICEFCEYERIFGYPPVALIRQYEVKDRKIRQQEEERRRVWEKAKARSRKGKKGKMLPKNNHSNNNTHSHTNDVHQAPPMTNTHSQDTQSEVYDDEDYEGEGNYELDSEPPMLVPVENNHVGAHGHRPEGGIGSGGGRQSSEIGVEGGGGGR